eukprot:scaffold4183_cov188-Alexandrium_tamarense.AAC.8
MSSADTASVIRRNMMGIELLLLPDAWVSVISCDALVLRLVPSSGGVSKPAVGQLSPKPRTDIQQTNFK